MAPSYVYQNPGRYVATLIVEDAAGQSGQDIIYITVCGDGINCPPIADAGPDQTIFLGDSTHLSGTATDPDGDPIVEWTWTIESAPPGSSPLFFQPFTPTPALVPDLLGDYVISLVVSDGIDYSLPDTVTVSVVKNLPPMAIADADVTSGDAPLYVAFDGSQSYDPEGAAFIIWWNFGDGSPASDELSPLHVYDMPGQYVARLTVIDNAGQSDVDSIEITVCGTVYSGDFDEDCYVDFYDFAVLAAAWISEPPDSNWNPACDISDPNDNVIDGLDLAVFTGNWLSGI